MKRRYAVMMMVGVLTLAWSGAAMAGQPPPATGTEKAVFTVA